MTPQHVADYRDGLNARLAKSVSHKLGCAVTLCRWIERPTGDIPVFLVPAAFVEQARTLGLTVDAA